MRGLARGFQLQMLTGMKLWLRADVGVTLSGSNVTAWADQSGRGNTPVITTANPTIVTSAIGGLPAVQFSAANQRMRNSSTNLVGTDAARHVFTVCQPRANGTVYDSGGPILGMRLAGVTFTVVLGRVNSGPQTIIYTDGATLNEDISGGPAIVNTSYVFDLSDVGGVGNNKIAVALNGTSQTLDNSAQSLAETGTTGFTIGGRDDAGSTQWFGGYLSEVIVFDRVLSTLEASIVRHYLGSRYGITVAG